MWWECCGEARPWASTEAVPVPPPPPVPVSTPWAQILTAGPQREAVGITNVDEETDPGFISSLDPTSGFWNITSADIGRDRPGLEVYLTHHLRKNSPDSLRTTRVVCE